MDNAPPTMETSPDMESGYPATETRESAILLSLRHALDEAIRIHCSAFVIFGIVSVRSALASHSAPSYLNTTVYSTGGLCATSTVYVLGAPVPSVSPSSACVVHRIVTTRCAYSAERSSAHQWRPGRPSLSQHPESHQPLSSNASPALPLDDVDDVATSSTRGGAVPSSAPGSPSSTISLIPT